MRLLASLASLLLLNACYFQYPHPVLKDGGSFSGILQSSHTGAGNESTGPIKVVWIHGMCHHGDDWVVGTVNALHKAVGFQSMAAVHAQPRRLRWNNKVVEVWSVSGSIGTQPLSLQFVVWSNVTLQAKANLCYDVTAGDAGDEHAKSVCQLAGAAPENKDKRAAINEMLKSRIMDTCFVDALLYADGHNKGVIRDSVAMGICAALLNENENVESCESDPYNWQVQAQPTLLVTASLGSRIAYDAMLEHQARGKSETALKSLLFQRRVDNGTATYQGQLFMLANQLPLYQAAAEGIGQPGPRAVPSNAFPLFGALEKLRGRSGLATQAPEKLELVLVGFSDPNDMLTFKLRLENIAQSEQGGIELHVVNVISSNSRTIRLPGIVIERPDEAHFAYDLNSCVLRMIFHGSGALPADQGCTIYDGRP